MPWTVEVTDTALKQVRKIDREAARRILDFMDERVASSNHPRAIGQAPRVRYVIFWRYRVTDYRMICDLGDGALRILVVELGRRREVFR